ncbi:MAG: hypothetical protein M3Q16_05215 [Pseudomonadota bacterium]|nr:hypothetical protein [Pseudomonadota bacterium]
MKVFRMFAARSLAPALFLTSTIIFSVAGVAHAQYDASGQSGSSGQTGSSSQAGSSDQAGSSGQNSGGQPSGKDPYQVTKEKMDTGYVDQKKRVERNTDPASPSKDSHVPEFGKDKDGKPIKDPKYEQGGPIGPN